MYKEAIKFRIHGFGTNAIIGAEYAPGVSNKFFMEIEYKIGGGLGKAYTKSQGGGVGLAPIAHYPILTGGTIYRVGYKIGI